MNFKRGRAKNQRSGCLMCKHWKVSGFGKTRKDFETISSHKQRVFSQEALNNYFVEEMQDYKLTSTEFDGSMDYVDDYEVPYRRTYQPRVYVKPEPIIVPRERVVSF